MLNTMWPFLVTTESSWDGWCCMWACKLMSIFEPAKFPCRAQQQNWEFVCRRACRAEGGARERQGSGWKILIGWGSVYSRFLRIKLNAVLLHALSEFIYEQASLKVCVSMCKHVWAGSTQALLRLYAAFNRIYTDLLWFQAIFSINAQDF